MSTATRRPLPKSAYGRAHQQARERVRPFVESGQARCARCGMPIEVGQEWDLGHDDARPGQYSGPECIACKRGTAGRWAQEEAEPPEREGLASTDPCWDVPWLKGLRRVPRNATWPRLMTVPHPDAVGSLGAEFSRWAARRSGKPLRWWQRLVATRLLEIDAEGRLCWETMILTLARQLGKSWLLRELMLWRVHQGDRFGEPQLVLNTGKDLAILKEVQRPARIWAKARRDAFKTVEVNGQESIELLVDGSRWMLRAKEAVYGYGASVGAVDEGWKVRASSVEEGLVPTMVEREQAQLWLVSTAHRKATALMLGRRKAALDRLETGDGDLLIEWSAPRTAELDDPAGWKQASPHWTKQRERLIRSRCEAALAGESDDPEEPDPLASFESQWLNRWPRRKAMQPGAVQDLLPDGMWAGLREAGLAHDGPVFVALEDDFGRGAAVAVAAKLPDGRIEVDGWERLDWDTAVEDALALASSRRIRELHVGASMLDRIPASGLPKPRPAVSAQTRGGLALLRDLAAGGKLVHDETTHELDVAVAGAQVKEQLTGLYLVPRGPTHLVRATAWALSAAHRPARVPSVR